MSDPMTSLRDHFGVLGVAMTHWADRDSAQDQPAASRAGRAAVDAIDALLGELYLLRGRLAREIREAAEAARRRIA
jgi:hypothetical protein